MPNKNLILIGAGVGLVLVVGAVWAARRVLPAVGAAVNPLNRENIFNQGAGGVVSVLTGREETLGGWLAELFDPATRELARVLGAPPATVASNPVEAQGYGTGAFL
jgi:hypothetical protein